VSGEGTIRGLPPMPVPQDTGDPHADFHQRSMLPWPSPLCMTCTPPEPHEFVVHLDELLLPMAERTCAECQLPDENARHRGAYTATITIHGNVLASVREEAIGVYQFVASRDEEDPIWTTITLPE
jgi:hypothetical protein